MAKKSIIARQKKREGMVARYLEKYKKYKEEGNYEALDKLPKNALKIRLKNRCLLTGRARGYMRKFGVSRLMFRELAAEGKIPGVKKASW